MNNIELQNRIDELERRLTLLERLAERTGGIVEELAAWHDRENLATKGEDAPPILGPLHPLSVAGQRRETGLADKEV